MQHSKCFYVIFIKKTTGFECVSKLWPFIIINHCLDSPP